MNKIKNVLSFKTETNGFPLWGKSSDLEGQPHLVRLAAVLCDGKTQEVIDQMDVVIRPDGWDIPQKAIESHGIAFDHAVEKGISESDAIEMFMMLFKDCGFSVSSNKLFNNRIIRIALKRFGCAEYQEVWDNKERHFCAVKMAKDDLKNRSVNLFDALAHYTGQSIINNTDSMVNAESAAKVFFAINNK